ncbi:EcsC protein family protein [compost metagenome]
MTDPYLLQVQEQVREWESRGPTFLNRIEGLLLTPLQQAAEAFIPDELHDEVAHRLEHAMKGLHQVGHRLVEPDKIRQQLGVKTEILGSPFQASDGLARSYWAWGLTWAGIEGGLTGAAGWGGFLLDVPALYTIALRTTQQIAVCYGYDLASEKEQRYSMSLLKAGSAANMTSRFESMLELKKLEHALIAEGIRRLGVTSVASTVTREVAGAVSMQLLRRKALQFLPFVGSLIGASFNAYFIHEVAETAYMSYRRRKLAELQGEADGEVGPIRESIPKNRVR